LGIIGSKGRRKAPKDNNKEDDKGNEREWVNPLTTHQAMR